MKKRIKRVMWKARSCARALAKRRSNKTRQTLGSNANRMEEGFWDDTARKPFKRVIYAQPTWRDDRAGGKAES
jgi:hypothetical protein